MKVLHTYIVSDEKDHFEGTYIVADETVHLLHGNEETSINNSNVIKLDALLLGSRITVTEYTILGVLSLWDCQYFFLANSRHTM